MENTLDLLEALEHIDPAGLSYQDWVAVGMGLKEAGYPASAWEDWSRRDGKRYHPGECLRKWESFTGECGAGHWRHGCQDGHGHGLAACALSARP